jgi:hypothetical protein
MLKIFWDFIFLKVKKLFFVKESRENHVESIQEYYLFGHEIFKMK